MRRIIEKYWPFTVTVLITVLFYKKADSFKELDKLLSKLLESSLTVCGTLLGFLLTITTIISAVNTRRMRWIRDAGYFGTLQKYLNISIILNLLVVFLALIIPFVLSTSVGLRFLIYIQTVEVFFIIWTLLASARFIQIFIRLLSEND
jgi:hypothetical protein